ncbi:MAG TPA: hypothetical protein PLU17_01135 [Chitinophagaceae bacterium]|nr:hypothetical protein [Chitinophagaceae bacterium]
MFIEFKKKLTSRWKIDFKFLLLLLALDYAGAIRLNAQNSNEAVSSTGLIFYQDSVKVGDQTIYSILVKEVIPNSPASLTEIKANDKLIAFNGIISNGDKSDIEKVNALMTGLENSTVGLEIERSEAHKSTKRMTYVIERKKIIQNVKQRIFGIGVTLIVDSIFADGKSGYAAKVQFVYPNSPAFKADVESGDFIVEVDGMRIDGRKPNAVNQVMDRLLIDEPRVAMVSFLRLIDGVFTEYKVKMQRVDISDFIKLGSISAEAQRLNRVPIITEPERKILITERDSDGDGIQNELDACPNEIGIESNSPFDNGCPEKKE